MHLAQGWRGGTGPRIAAPTGSRPKCGRAGPVAPIRMSLATACLLLALLPGSAQAGPEALAIALPVPQIRVDGDLADWPADATRYPVSIVGAGNAMRDARDCVASFRVGYSFAENALYVALEVEDDSVVRGEPGAWNYSTQDGAEVYLRTPGGAAAQYVLWGQERGAFGAGSVVQATVGERWREDGYQLEWRIDMRAASEGRLVLGPHTQMRFDVAVCDRDADGSSSWLSWSEGIGKLNNPNHQGRLVLAQPGTSVDQVLALVGQTTSRRPDDLWERLRRSSGYQMFCAGVLVAFALLHLLLFLFDPRSRANLLFALYTGIIAALIFLSFHFETRPEMPPPQLNQWRQLAAIVVGGIGLGFLYSLFTPQPPRRFWLLVLGLGIATAAVAGGAFGRGESAVLSEGVLSVFLGILLAGVLVETFLVLLHAVRHRCEGAWIIGPGFAVFALKIFPLLSHSEMDVSRLYWVLIPLMSISVYMARSVGRTNRTLAGQLRRIEELSHKTRQQYEQIQEQNRQIQAANQHKSEFLARMSHDLRTPMNAIIGYTRIMLRKAREQLDERQYRNLENVHLSANNLLALINDILDLSKIEAGRVEVRPAPVDLKALAAECAAAVEPLLAPEVHMVQDLALVPAVCTDADRLRRVLTNLLSNAAKFTERGTITLSLRAVDGWAELAVADTGIGIPAAQLPLVFEEFRQVERKEGARREGTGLGLAIVKRSMELLGGSVQAQSEEGKGSLFTLRVRDYAASPAVLSPRAQAAAEARRRLLRGSPRGPGTAQGPEPGSRP
ncbi:MAG: ATP-binding protein [Candidatus Latescibacterota bacterium]